MEHFIFCIRSHYQMPIYFFYLKQKLVFISSFFYSTAPLIIIHNLIVSKSASLNQQILNVITVTTQNRVSLVIKRKEINSKLLSSSL